MPLFRLAALCLAVSLAAIVPARAHAQGRREKLLKLLAARPKRMSLDTWREQRREAARELGRLKERRAVPTLLRIIAKERFDVILEIAIDSLGEIGDKRAVGPLRKLLGDPSLDSYVRDAAAGALKKLRGGGGGGHKPKGGGHKPKGGGGRPKGGGGGSGGGGTHGSAEKKDAFGKLVPLRLPKLSATEIARVTRIDVIAGNGAVSWDAGSQQTTAGFSLAARYLRQHERRALGYTIDAAADFAFNLADPPGSDSTWTLGHNLRVFPEIRAYPFGRDVPKLFGQISAGLSYGLALSHLPAATTKRFAFNSTVSIGGGPGYGRIIDIGQRVRLKRVAWVMRKAGLLTGPIDLAIGNKIIAAWYALRNNIGNYQQLGHTIRILRKAGLLTHDVDAATAYRLVRILDDPQLYDRRQGILLRVGYGYSRTLRKDADDTTMAFAYATAELQRQLGTTRAVGGAMRFFYNNWGEPDTYGLDLSGRYDMFFYNRAFDPLGAMGIDAHFTLNNQHGGAFDQGGVAWRASGGLSYSRYFNRGSMVRLTASGGVDTAKPFFMLTLEARYGVVRGSFVNAQ